MYFLKLSDYVDTNENDTPTQDYLNISKLLGFMYNNEKNIITLIFNNYIQVELTATPEQFKKLSDKIVAISQWINFGNK